MELLDALKVTSNDTTWAKKDDCIIWKNSKLNQISITPFDGISGHWVIGWFGPNRIDVSIKLGWLVDKSGEWRSSNILESTMAASDLEAVAICCALRREFIEISQVKLLDY